MSLDVWALPHERENESLLVQKLQAALDNPFVLEARDQQEKPPNRLGPCRFTASGAWPGI
jgi:hypothetical protein